MASSITYKGVESAEGGNIFDRCSFWVAMRVPMRKSILDMIKNNGGVVAALEKNADMLIADHARKDAPPGSYSWKLITDSVDNGIIQLKDRYRIGRDPEIPRPAAGGGLTKATRTAFTHAEDVALAKWALSHAVDRTGNKIYQKFAETNARHTWQSWRNRFVKTLLALPPDRLEALAAEPDEQADEANPANKPSSPKSDKEPATRPNQHSSVSKDRNTTPEAAMSRDMSVDVAEPDDADLQAMREEFLKDLAIFKEVNEMDFPLRPRIGSRVVDLYDLGMVVHSQEESGTEVDWSEVARSLNYRAREASIIAAELQQFYEENLAPFFEATADFSADVQEDDAIESEQYFSPIVPAPRIQLESPQPFIPSSPPMGISGTKRTSDGEEQHSPERSTKRRRRSRSEEIPSTPDGKLRPTWPGIISQHATPAMLESQPSSIDVTPSQQLQLEFLNTEPVPLDLDPGRRDRSTSSSQEIPAEEGQQRGLSDPDAIGVSDADAHDDSVVPATPTQRKVTAVKRSLPASFQGSAGRRLLSPLGQPEGRQQRQIPPISPRIPDREKENEQAISVCIEYYESLGYPYDIVVEALRRTTMTPGGVASHVMQSLKDKQGVPSHHEGVWTDRDDDSLRLVDSVVRGSEPSNPREVEHRKKAKREWDRLEKKHGLERIELRRKFIEAEDLKAPRNFRW